MLATIFGVSGTKLSTRERAFFREIDPWGYILFDRNIESKAQLAALTQDLRELQGRDCPILIDQEGGRVQRLKPPHWRAYPPALQQANQARDLERAMWLRGRLIAQELHEVGVDVNCAPLGDLARAETTDRVQNRCYGYDVERVVRAAQALHGGQLAGGVLGVLKHLPGHGRARADSHLTLPRVTTTLRELEQTDFAAFKALNTIPMAMTAHVQFDVLDDTGPFTTSRKAMVYAREKMEYHGLMMSDDLDMDALEGPLANRARAARSAGVDIILHCNGHLEDMQDIAEAAGPLEDTSLARARAALAQKMPPEPFDVQSAIAELDRLTENPSHE